jgi:hypothetical protein
MFLSPLKDSSSGSPLYKSFWTKWEGGGGTGDELMVV